MPRKKQSKKSPPDTASSISSTRRTGTRSSGKAVQSSTGETGSGKCAVICESPPAHPNIGGTQKRKAKDTPPADQPTKRSNTRGSKQTLPSTDTEEVAEPTPRMDIRTAEQGRFKHSPYMCSLTELWIAANNRGLKTITRKAPTRPVLSSDSEDGEPDLQDRTTDGSLAVFQFLQ